MILQGRVRRLLSETLIGDRYLLKSIPQNSIRGFLDIGANLGLVSIFARLLHPYARVVAVEPFKESFLSMQENVSNMKILSVHTALGDGTECALRKDRKTPMCNSFLPVHQFGGSRGIQESIQSKRIEELVGMTKIGPENLAIKIDCEGAEHFVFSSPESIGLLRRVPYIAVEVHDISPEMTRASFVRSAINTLSSTHSINVKEDGCLVQLVYGV